MIAALKSPSDLRGQAGSRLLRSRSGLQQPFHASHVLRYIYAHGVVFDFGDANLCAVFHPAELLELLNLLEFTLRKGRIFKQGIATKDVKPEVLHVADLYVCLRVAHPGNRGAREIKRVVVEIHDNLDDVGVHYVGRPRDGSSHGRDRIMLVFEQSLDNGVHGGGVEKRFVSLDVHKHVALDVGGDLGDALGAGPGVGASHAGVATESAYGLDDPVVVGCDDHLVYRFGRLRAAVNPLNHRLARKRDKRFAGEAGRAVPRRNDYDYFLRTHLQGPFYLELSGLHRSSPAAERPFTFAMSEGIFLKAGCYHTAVKLI